MRRRGERKDRPIRSLTGSTAANACLRIPHSSHGWLVGYWRLRCKQEQNTRKKHPFRMQKGEIPCKRHSHSSCHWMTSPPHWSRWEGKALHSHAWQRLAYLSPPAFTLLPPPINASWPPMHYT